VSDAVEDAGSDACPSCGSNDIRTFDPYAHPMHGQPNPELLHLQHLTPRPPLAPGAMVGMGPYMPLPRPSSPPARWAEDPTGRNQYRWWTGSRWSDTVANDGVTATDPLT
jgi:hypothetical protein